MVDKQKTPVPSGTRGQLVVPPWFPTQSSTGGLLRGHGHGQSRAMPYTLITVVTPAEPTGAPSPEPFGRRLPGPFAGLGSIGSHLPRLSELPVEPLLVLFAVVRYSIVRIIWRAFSTVKRTRRRTDSPTDRRPGRPAPPARR